MAPGGLQAGCQKTTFLNRTWADAFTLIGAKINEIAGVERLRPGCTRSCAPDDFSRAPFPQELEIFLHPVVAK